MYFTRRFRDLTGERYGRLTVIEFAGRDKSSKNLWKCHCDCGNECIASTSILKSGDKRSCGCLHKEVSKAKIKKLATTHGLSKTRLHNIWWGMKKRCASPSYSGWEYYGARGIKVCNEWKDFMAFYQWSMDHGYNDELTIDRIDSNGDYEPSNCRWVTIKEQQKNRRSTRYITHHGLCMTLSEWGKYYGRNRTYFARRTDEDIIERMDMFERYKEENHTSYIPPNVLLKRKNGWEKRQSHIRDKEGTR